MSHRALALLALTLVVPTAADSATPWNEASPSAHSREPARLAAFPGQRRSGSRPKWWNRELELTPHVERRMEDRDFTEVQLREMLERATGYHPDVVEDRFIVEARFKGRAWEVVVEPDQEDDLLVVVTAYRVDR